MKGFEYMPCYQEIHCPHCNRNEIVKAGKSVSGTQRYRCQSSDCSTGTFMLEYRYNACKVGVKEQAIDMAVNGSGIRDTARVLKISRNTVISSIKKNRQL